MNKYDENINWTKEFSSVEDVQQLVNEENLSSIEFKTKYPKLYKRVASARWLDYISFSDINMGFYDSIDKIQEIINNPSNHINSAGDFKKKFPCLYYRCYRNKWLTSLKYLRGQKNWDSATFEDAQQLINEGDLTKTEFRLKYPGLLEKCNKNNWFSSLIFKEPEKRTSRWDYYDSIEKVQELIDRECLNAAELHDGYPGLYGRCYFNGWLNSLIYRKNNKPFMETHFDRLFPADLYSKIKRDCTELDWLKLIKD